MWAEYYPYTAGSSSIGSEMLFPDTWEEVLGFEYEETIFDPSQDKFLNKEEFLQVSKEDPGRIVIVYSPPRKDWLPKWLEVPHMVVGSDSMWSEDDSLGWDSDPTLFAGHPRTSGAHSTVLQLAREAGVDLMFTLKQPPQLLVGAASGRSGDRADEGARQAATRDGRRHRRVRPGEGRAPVDLQGG